MQMKTAFSFLLGAAMVSVGLQASAQTTDLLFASSASPNPFTGFHPGIGSVTFTVQNATGLDGFAPSQKIEVASIGPPESLFLSGDEDDKITNVVHSGGSLGNGSILDPGGSGTYIVSFVLTDSRDPLDPDQDIGHWNIRVPISVRELLNPSVTDPITGMNGKVDVLDAGVPEPSAFALCGMGAISLLGYRKAKSHG
jgi:hypothetical protein